MDDRNIRTDLGADGVLVAVIDMPGRSMNVFSAALMDSVERLLETVAANDAIKAVILTSGKAVFLAGADLDMVRMFTQRARSDPATALHELCGRLGRLFRRLETQGKPFIAAINGLALGGGLEVALACHERVASDKAQMGLPEIRLGLLPGAGGTQRLPRLVGRQCALEMMLSGDSCNAVDALRLGIVDAVVAAEDLMNEARRSALRLAAGPAVAPWDRPGWRWPAGGPESPIDRDAFMSSLGSDAEQRRSYPAYDAIIACVEGGWRMPMTEAGHWEMDRFVELIQDPVAGNMIRALFLDRQRAAKATGGAARRPARVLVTGTKAAEVAEILRAARVLVDEAGPSAAPDPTVSIATDALPQMQSNPIDGVAAETVAWLRGSSHSSAAFGAGVGIWVGDASALGRAVEVCVSPGADESAGLDLARWLRATAMVTRGPSLLQRLAAAHSATYSVEERLLAVALAAARHWAAGAVADLGIADSVAVIAGLHPAYTGGPFNYLKQRGAAALADQAERAAQRHGAAFALPVRWAESWAAFERAA